MAGFRFRPGRIQFGPLRFNLGTKGGLGVTSVSVGEPGLGTVRLWGRDGTRGLTSIDTPGLGSFRRTLTPRSRREGAAQDLSDQETLPPLSHVPGSGR